MKVKILVGAQAAYACIETSNRTLDVRLSSGKSAAQSLRQYAQEEQERAAAILGRAALALQAAEVLDSSDAEFKFEQGKGVAA